MKLRYLFLPLVLGSSSLVVAEVDGTLGTTSTGSTDISISIGEQLQVSVETDVSLTYTSGSPSSGSTGVCVYRRNDADVGLTLTSNNEDNDGGAHPTLFSMVSGADRIHYTVAISGDDTVASITSGNQVSLSNANTTQTTCGGAYGHSIDVNASAARLDAAPAGSYSDTVTILAEPI